MKRRTKIKLENAKLYARKYCLNSRYKVRNTVAVLSVGALVGTAAFAFSGLSFAFPTVTGNRASIEEAAKNTLDQLTVEAATNHEDGTSQYSVNLSDSSSLTTATIDSLKRMLENSEHVSISAVDVQVLSAANIDVENLFIVKATDLNVRSGAGEEESIIARLGNGACGTVLESKDGWTKISSGNVIGYVKSEYILTGDEAIKEASSRLSTIAVVNADEVNVRSSGSGEGIVIYSASKNDSFEVNEDYSDKKWVCVKLYDGTYGYISSEYVSTSKGLLTAISQNSVESYEYAKAEAVENAMKGDESAQAFLNREFGQSVSDSDDSSESESASGDYAVVADASDSDSSSDSSSDYSESDSSSADTDHEDTSYEEDSSEDTSDDDEDEENDSEEEDYDSGDDSSEEDSDSEDSDSEDEDSDANSGPGSSDRDSLETSVSDLYLLAAIVYGESGGECYEGQLAVANVVLNRLYSGYYGSTLSDVIYAPYQFTATWGSNFQEALSTGGSSTSLQAAQDALNGNNNIGSYMSFRPTWYADPSDFDDCYVIGNHIFF